MNDSVQNGGDPYAGVNPSQGYYIFQAILLLIVMIITILGNVAVSRKDICEFAIYTLYGTATYMRK